MGIGFAVPKVVTSDGILRRGVEVIAAEADALRLMGERLDSDFVEACRTIYSAAGRVVITGMHHAHTGATLSIAMLSIATLNGTMCDDTMRHSSAATRST